MAKKRNLRNSNIYLSKYRIEEGGTSELAANALDKNNNTEELHEIVILVCVIYLSFPLSLK